MPHPVRPPGEVCLLTIAGAGATPSPGRQARRRWAGEEPPPGAPCHTHKPRSARPTAARSLENSDQALHRARIAGARGVSPGIVPVRTPWIAAARLSGWRPPGWDGDAGARDEAIASDSRGTRPVGRLLLGDSQETHEYTIPAGRAKRRMLRARQSVALPHRGIVHSASVAMGVRVFSSGRRRTVTVVRAARCLACRPLPAPGDVTRGGAGPGTTGHMPFPAARSLIRFRRPASHPVLLLPDNKIGVLDRLPAPRRGRYGTP